MLWLLIGAALVVFLAVLLLRAAAFKPAAEEKFEEDPIDLDHDRIVESMQQMIRCKTVSNRHEDLVETCGVYRELYETQFRYALDDYERRKEQKTEG